MGRVTDIDYARLLQLLIPVKLRQAVTIAWLSVLTEPIRVRLYNRFKNWESRCWYDIKYQSGSVAHLEYVLNDKLGYDPAERLIRLGPGSRPNRLYLPLREQNAPILLGRVYLYNREDYLTGTYDFKIMVEESIIGTFNEELCRAVADRYKRDSKSYIISYEAF